MDDDMDDDGPEAEYQEDQEPVVDQTRWEVTRVVKGSALRIASVIGENWDREPKAVVKDNIQYDGMGAIQDVAARIRIGIVAILRVQYNLYCNQDIPEDRRRRIMTYPYISKEDGEELCAFLDATGHHELIPGSEFLRVVKKYGARFSDGEEEDEAIVHSDGSRRVAAAPRV